MNSPNITRCLRPKYSFLPNLGGGKQLPAIGLLPAPASYAYGHSLLQAFSGAIFRICGASRGPSALAELLLLHIRTDRRTDG